MLFVFVVLQECFEYYDKSGDGVIDKSELPEALKFAGIDSSKTDLDSIIKLFDINGRCIFLLYWAYKLFI